MELDLVLTPEDESDVSHDRGLASPMGGKHQRDLSLSAKWANNKALALEYLKRQREAILWIENVLDRKLETRDLFEALKSGIVLREVMAKLYPTPTECRSPISRRYSLRMAPWKERENISIFLKQCKALGMDDLFLFCTDDLYEGTNMVQVLFSVQHFMAFAQEKSSHLFKPIVHEHVVFSNQEVEMALSEIEKAGVEANALLTSAPPSASPSPAKSQLEEENDESDAPTSSDDDASASEEKHDQEPADHELDDKVEGEDNEVDVLSVLELELLDHHDSNNDMDQDDEELQEDEQDEEEEPAALDGEPDDEEAESRLPPLEMDDEDSYAMLALNEQEAQMEAVALAAIEIDQSIQLLEIVDEMLLKIEQNERERMEVHEEKAPVLTEGEGEFLTNDDVEIVRIDSVALSELTDKHDTYVGDSLAPTVVDTAAAGTDSASGPRPNRFSRAGRASKKASKAASKAAKRAQERSSTDEPLDEEAMSRCTCGSKCTIM